MSYNLLCQKIYDLIRWIYPNLSKLPKKQRSVLAQRIEIMSIRILEMVIDLRETDTRINRKKIIHEIEKLQILLRLCKDLSFLSFRQYEYASSLLAEISNLLGSQKSEPKTQDSRQNTEDFGKLAKLRGGGSLKKWF